MSSDLEGRFPFAITKARLGQVLRGWASVNAEIDVAAGGAIVSTNSRAARGSGTPEPT